ncbi:MAG: thiamine diphosphokinase [Defluviitaleaceae bacterium]|nr:thiamine diphosphokinase [Defluviitaleaceae bacterium]
MRAVIISGGAVVDYDFVKSQICAHDTVICADSGYDHAVKMGLEVNIVVGDLDSISTVPKDVEYVKYPTRKDLTDTEIAITYARSRGFKNFLLLAATGTRLDHTLTNIFLLKSFLDYGENAVLVDEHNKIMLTDSHINLHESKGSIVSLIPLNLCTSVTTMNLEYPLQNATMQVGKGLGVSNIITSETASITIKSGLMLIIIARD